MTLSAQQLALGQLAAEFDGAVYTCPEGARAILRDIRLTAKGMDAAWCDVWVKKSAGGFHSLYLKEIEGEVEIAHFVDAFIVLEEGDELRVYIYQGWLQLMVSGHEFFL